MKRYSSASHALGRFRAQVFADDALQMALATRVRPTDFRASVLDAAKRRSLRLDAELEFGVEPPLSRRWLSPQWLPVRADGGSVEWSHFAGAALAEPFYALSALRAGSRPFNRLFRVSMTLDDFIAGADRGEARAPDGLVFHMSRCGSTLVGRMLAAVPGSVVILEAPPIDAVLRFAGDEARRIAALRAMVGALGRPRSADDRHYFVKLDSWHVLELPLFRRAFPSVPWIFLYRDPAEVLASHQAMPGMHMAAGVLPPEVLDVALDTATPNESYRPRVLARLCDAAADHFNLGGGLLVNYADLPDAAAPAIFGHFGLPPTAARAEAVIAAGRRDSKSGAPFVLAGDGSRCAAGASADKSALDPADRAYARLEALRSRVAAAML